MVRTIRVVAFLLVLAERGCAHVRAVRSLRRAGSDLYPRITQARCNCAVPIRGGVACASLLLLGQCQLSA